MVMKVEVERFSVISSKPFESVVQSVKTAVGHPDMAEFAKATKSARNSATAASSKKRMAKTSPRSCA